MSEQEQVQVIGGIPLKPRKRASTAPTKKAAKKKKALTEKEQANEEASMEELAKISDVLDPDAANVVNIIGPDGDPLEVEIYKCKARQLGNVMRFLSHALSELNIENMKDAEDMMDKLNHPGRILSLLGNVVDEAMDVAATMSSIDAETMRELDVDDALGVVMGVWLVNQAFFLQRVMPMIQNLTGGGSPSTSD
jgi:hypothetical protein